MTESWWYVMLPGRPRSGPRPVVVRRWLRYWLAGRGWTAHYKIMQACKSDRRQYVDAALARLVERGVVEVQQVQGGRRYRLTPWTVDQMGEGVPARSTRRSILSDLVAQLPETETRRSDA